MLDGGVILNVHGLENLECVLGERAKKRRQTPIVAMVQDTCRLPLRILGNLLERYPSGFALGSMNNVLVYFRESTPVLAICTTAYSSIESVQYVKYLELASEQLPECFTVKLYGNVDPGNSMAVYLV